MGNIFCCCCKKKDRGLSVEERQTIANKRLQYLESKPVTKPLDKTKRVEIINEDKKHEHYLRDIMT